MPSLKTVAATACGLATTVLGHGFVTEFDTDGTSNQGFLLDYYYEKVNTGSFPDIAAWYAENLDSGFVAPDAYDTSDINCHKNSAPGVLTASVAAGGEITFQWPADWPHPYGPILTYVAACAADCSEADKSALSWVKIEESGIDYDTQVWASQVLVDQAGKWTTKVPSSLKPGNYVFRHEIIALHGAGSENGAQNYPQCFNIEVTGSGSSALPAGTLGVDLYTSTDPGILFNPYTTITEYVIPGPELWTG